MVIIKLQNLKLIPSISPKTGSEISAKHRWVYCILYGIFQLFQLFQFINYLHKHNIFISNIFL